MMRKRLLASACVALLCSPANATDMTIVNTPSNGANPPGSLVSGKLVVANGAHGITDSGILPIVRFSQFNPVKAVAYGVTNCPLVASSQTITCTGGVTFGPSDLNDIVSEQYGGASGHPFTSFVDVAPSPGSTSVHIHDVPTMSSAGGLALFNLTAQAAGSGYQVATTPNGGSSVQSLTGGTALIAGTGNAREWTAAGAVVNAGGTGGTNGACTFAVAPTGTSRALQGVWPTFSGTVSGNAISGALTLVTGATVLSLDSSYTYDGSGRHDGLPVVGCGLSGAKVNVSFGIVTETITPRTAVYTTTPPLSCTSAACTTSNDHGTGLTVTFATRRILESICHDNQSSFIAAIAYSNLANSVGSPVSISADAGPYCTSAIPLADAAQGRFSWIGDGGMFQTVIALQPNTCNDLACSRGEVFPVVDANPNGSYGSNSTMMSFMDTSHATQAGLYIANTAFLCDNTSSTLQNAVTLYGITFWFGFFQDAIMSCRGGIGEGFDAAGQMHIGEGYFDDLRLENDGDSQVNPAEPTGVISLDSGGTQAGPTQIFGKTLRFTTENGPTIESSPCSSGGGASKYYFTQIKDENSGSNPYGNDLMQFGASIADCTSKTWPKIDGTLVTGAANEAGVGAVFISDTILTFPFAGYAALHLRGNQSSDISQFHFFGQFVGGISSGRGDGIGAQIDVAQNSVKIDLLRCDVNDYCLQAVSKPNANSIGAGAIDLETEGNTYATNAEAGALPIMCGDWLGNLSSGACTIFNLGTVSATSLTASGTVNGGGFASGANTGVSCVAGINATTFRSINGLVTHC